MWAMGLLVYCSSSFLFSGFLVQSVRDENVVFCILKTRQSFNKELSNLRTEQQRKETKSPAFPGLNILVRTNVNQFLISWREGGVLEMCSLEQLGEKVDKTQGNVGGWHQEQGASLLCSRKAVLKFSSQHTQGMQVDIASLSKSGLWPQWYQGRMGVANTLRKKRSVLHSLAAWG